MRQYKILPKYDTFLVISKIEKKVVIEQRHFYTCEFSETFLFAKLYMSYASAISCLHKHR